MNTTFEMISAYKGDIFAILTGLFWATAVVFFRLSGESIKPLPLKVFQNFVTLLLFATCIFFSQESITIDLTPWQWGQVALSALLGISVGETLFVAAINRIGAGFQAIIDCLYAPLIIVTAYFVFEESLGAREIIGVVLIVTAISLTGWQKQKLPSGSRLWVGIAFGVLSQISFVACILILKDLLQEHSVLTLSFYRYVFGTILLVGFAATRRDSEQSMWEGFRIHPRMKWTLPSTVLGPFLATIMWLAGFKYTTAGRAAIYNQLSTIFIIVLAAAFLNERLTRMRFVALVISIAGSLLVTWP